MGIFSDNVTQYFESGLVCIPVGDRKAPILGTDWQQYCDKAPPAELVEKWEKKYGQAERIGLCMGQASGLVAFDFDYDYDPKRVKAGVSEKDFLKDLKVVEAHIVRALPQTPAIKVGKKGWTRFYKWTPELDNTSNLSCDRNGVRLFDFLSWHKQTILPPSIHSATADGQTLVYRWTGQAPILECLDDIPPISLAVVREMRLIFGESVKMPDNSRHGRLFGWLMKISEVEKDPVRLISLLIARDIAVNSADKKGPYLADRAHFKGAGPADNARGWIERVLRWKEAKVDLGEKRGKAIDPESWEYFFENSFPILRKDILSKKVFIKPEASADWTDIVSLEGTLRNKGGDIGLPRPQVKDRLEQFVFEKKDEQFLCDIPAWDGVDRVAQFGQAIKCDEFTADDMTLILKHWGSGIFRRIDDSDNQNRCLILKGDQGLGKDSLVKAMLRDFSPYFETSNLTGQPKDIYEIISRVYVLHIEEFEQTQGQDVAFIKSIITQASAFFRESYGRSPSRKTVAISMISTSNRDDILRDPTGNRRFIVCPVSGVSWDYPTDQSPQVLAQFKAHFEAGEFAALPKDLEVKIKVILDAFTPPDTNEILLEMYIDQAGNLIDRNKSPGPSRAASPAEYLSSVQVAPILNDIARQNGISINRVRSVIKARGYSRQKSGGGGMQYFSYSIRHRR